MADYQYDWGGRSPGQQNPGKYPRVGPAYMQFGEQQGYIYDPYGDRYFPDPKVANKYYEDSGLKPKSESPGLMGTVGPIAGAGLAYSAGTAIGKDPAGAWQGIRDAASGAWTAGKEAVGGYFGTGGEAAGTAANAGTTGATASTGATATGASSAGTLGTSGASATEASLGLASAAPTVGAGGTATIAAGAQIPAGYAAVGTAADGGTLIAPTADAGGSLLGTAGTALGIAGGVYGAYQLGKNLSDNQKDPIGGAAAGAAVGVGAMTAYGAMYGSYVGPWGTVIGAAVGAIVGLGLGMIGGNKDKDQLTRDAIRKNFQKQGILDKDFKLTLNDGTQFDVGKDGHFILPNGQRPYNVDFADQRAAETVGALNPAVAAMLGTGKTKYLSDFTGYMTNAVLSSQDPAGNIKGIYDKMGGRDVVYGRIVEMYKQGQLSANDANAMRAAIDKVYNVKNPNQGKGGEAEGFFMQDMPGPDGKKKEMPKVTGSALSAAPQQSAPQPGQAQASTGTGGVFGTAPKQQAPVAPKVPTQQLVQQAPQQQPPQQPQVKVVNSAIGAKRGK